MRYLLACAVVVSLWNVARLEAQQPPAAETAPNATARPEADDVRAVRERLDSMVRQLPSLLQTDPDAAERRLKEVRSLVDALEPTTNEGQDFLDEVRRALPLIEREIQTARLSLDKLQEMLRANPGDPVVNSQYSSKLAQELSLLARSDPASAEKKLNEAKAFVASLPERRDEAPAQRRLDEQLPAPVRRR